MASTDAVWLFSVLTVELLTNLWLPTLRPYISTYGIGYTSISKVVNSSTTYPFNSKMHASICFLSKIQYIFQIIKIWHL